VATFSKGTMRFIGGKLSKNEGGVTVKTPAGALAIRGGMFDARVNGRHGIFAFRYGVSLNYVGNNGERQEIFEQGYVLDLTGNTAVVREGTPEDTALFQNSLSGEGTAYVPGQNNQQNNQTTFETVSLQDLISDATTTQINDSLERDETNDTNTNNNTPPTNNTNNPPPNNTGNNPPPGTIQVETRVLLPPGVFTAFPGTPNKYTTGDGGNQGILGGDPNATVDDFKWTFSIVNNRLVGTVTGLTDSFLDENLNPVTKNIPDAAVDFPATFPGTQCAGGVCLVADAMLTQNGETTNYIGQFVGKNGFFAYNVIAGHVGDEDLVVDDDSDRILAFGGTAYNFGTPSGKVYLFAPTLDVREMSPAPFSSAASLPENGFVPGETTVSPLKLLTKDADPNSRSVWLQTSFYIGTSEDDGEIYDQQSFVNIALGGISETGGLIGARRGGAHVDVPYEGNLINNVLVDCTECAPATNRESLAFTGDIASLAAPNGSHFLGTDDPNIVIGFDTTEGGTQNMGRDIPLDPNSTSIESQSGSTYHVGVGIGSYQPATQQGGTFQGYAAGMVESGVPSEGFTNVVTTQSLDDFGLSFNSTTNTLHAGITVYDVHDADNATDGYIFGFGDDPQDPQNRSAYIDDQHFAAIESADGTSVIHQLNPSHQVLYQNAGATSYFVSGDQLNVTAYFPDVFGNPEDGIGQKFCTDCSFMKWGAWGSRVAFDNGDGGGDHYVDNIHLGWWVAGDPASATDLNQLGNQFATATYNGHVIGDVASKLNSENWRTYVTAGDLHMSWDFAARNGNLSITNFDGRGFQTGPNGLTQPSRDINRFAGSLTQFQGPTLNNLSGGAVGSFFKGPQSVAQGVGGNFNLKATDYKAGGIFIGSGIPVPGKIGP
ncbi:MAG TPA: hypothetical protein VMY42_19550, partial [Thermoguttaceae bacterium]|nr:hypothetical protein [Thermoguttaceae bacterium]